MQRVHIGNPANNEVGEFEAKTNFLKLLERANQGEEIIIAREGQPFAKLGPIACGHDVDDALAAAARIRQTAERIAQRNKIALEDIRSWVNEGRW